MANARESIKEPGVARVDVLQQADDQTRFLLVEVYRNAEAPKLHKETPNNSSNAFELVVAYKFSNASERKSRLYFFLCVPNFALKLE